jgi:hypothetical protein
MHEGRVLTSPSPNQIQSQDALIDKIVPVELTRAHLTDFSESNWPSKGPWKPKQMSKPISTGFARDLFPYYLGHPGTSRDILRVIVHLRQL